MSLLKIGSNLMKVNIQSQKYECQLLYIMFTTLNLYYTELLIGGF